MRKRHASQYANFGSLRVFQRFKDMARKLLEKMGFRQPQPKQGKAYTISLTY